MLMLAVLGLATTHRTRSDIEHSGCRLDSAPTRQTANLGTCLVMLNLMNGIYVRKGSDSSEDIFDAQFSHRFSRVIDQAARPTWRRWDDRDEQKRQAQAGVG
jgi:hypothetical protein